MQAIFIRESSVRFTKGKVYDLMPCSIGQANSCEVIDDGGTLLTFTSDRSWWLPITKHRNNIIDEILT